MAFQLTLAAHNDMIEVAAYACEHWGKDQARLYVSRIDGAFQLLGEQDHAGKPSELLGYFQYREGKHVIFYEIDQHDVLIVRIVHERALPHLHL